MLRSHRRTCENFQCERPDSSLRSDGESESSEEQFAQNTRRVQNKSPITDTQGNGGIIQDSNHSDDDDENEYYFKHCKPTEEPSIKNERKKPLKCPTKVDEWEKLNKKLRDALFTALPIDKLQKMDVEKAIHVMEDFLFKFISDEVSQEVTVSERGEGELEGCKDIKTGSS